MSDYLSAEQKSILPSEKISGDDAARLICSSNYMNSEELIGFDQVDASRFGLKQGDAVSIVPTDNGGFSLFLHPLIQTAP